MIPHAAKQVVAGIIKSMPKIISAIPLKLFNNLGLGKNGGMILMYIPGFLK